MFKIASSILMVLTVCVIGIAQKSAKPEDAIRKADQDWLRVFAAKDLANSVNFVIDDGSILGPNAPIATGHDAISQAFSGFFALPDLKIEWRPAKAEVARSGELGYTTGAYKMSFKVPTGKTIEDHGKYVTVWKKQNGKWKVAYDIFNSDLPAAQ
jgi:ketosteroid isomerase-like protein